MDVPRIADSARKHGVGDEIILHAFDHLVRSELLENDMVMLIGPDRAGNLFELGVVVTDSGPVIVHAMPARRKYLR